MFQFLCLISVGLQKHENEWQVYLFFELHNLHISLFHLGLHSHYGLHMYRTLILNHFINCELPHIKIGGCCHHCVPVYASKRIKITISINKVSVRCVCICVVVTSTLVK